MEISALSGQISYAAACVRVCVCVHHFSQKKLSQVPQTPVTGPPEIAKSQKSRKNAKIAKPTHLRVYGRKTQKSLNLRVYVCTGVKAQLDDDERAKRASRSPLPRRVGRRSHAKA